MKTFGLEDTIHCRKKREEWEVGGEMGESEQRNMAKSTKSEICVSLSSLFVAIIVIAANQFGDRSSNRCMAFIYHCPLLIRI